MVLLQMGKCLARSIRPSEGPSGNDVRSITNRAVVDEDASETW